MKEVKKKSRVSVVRQGKFNERGLIIVIRAGALHRIRSHV